MNYGRSLKIDLTAALIGTLSNILLSTREQIIIINLT